MSERCIVAVAAFSRVVRQSSRRSPLSAFGRYRRPRRSFAHALRHRCVCFLTPIPLAVLPTSLSPCVAGTVLLAARFPPSLYERTHANSERREGAQSTPAAARTGNALCSAFAPPRSAARTI
ncbi:hypothetical protein C8Q79DRAFT_33280 [Trametes meyenii]|nr:hypothetical protein C8Q79DRAFT_33280 [Trametes meyenii]